MGEVTTNYLVDTLNPTGLPQVMDEVVNGAVTRTYAYGLQRISEDQLINGAWTPSFYGYDGHGNVRFLTNSAGTITDSYAYDAFGLPITTTGSTPNNYLYSGEQYDGPLGLYYLRARYYNPATGRFLTMDPWKGESCCRSNSCRNSWSNTYAFADENPVNRIDPTGHDAIGEYVTINEEEGILERVILKKVALETCKRTCETGCDLVAPDPVAYLTCYFSCERACYSYIYPPVWF